jgi:hypothetical protein
MDGTTAQRSADGWSNTAAEPTLNRDTREMDGTAQTLKMRMKQQSSRIKNRLVDVATE